MSISARVAELFDSFADCAAVLAGDATTTWGDLAANAGALDRLMADAGFCGSVPVGVVLRHRAGPIGAVVGALGSRRCAVLLNPTSADPELAAEIAGRAAPVVVATAEDWTRPGLAEAARTAGVLALTLPPDGLPFRLDPAAPVAQRLPAGFDGVAMTVLTSGTTGAAKRVSLPYRRLDQLAGGSPAADPRTARGATINTLPLVSIGGALGLAGTIWRGRPIAVMDRFDVGEWVRLVRRHRPRRAGAPPAVLRMILEAGVRREDLASITAFETGSAPVDPALAAEFEAAYGIPVLVSYGATEFLAAVTTWTIEDWQRWSPAKRGSVGRAVPGFAVRVVDDGGRPLAPDQAGRLEVRAREDGRWTATHDLARIDADGFVWILGRDDDVLIRGGFKVASEKVRRVLERHPSVIEAAVVGLHDDRLGHVPAALVAADPAVVDEAELVAWAGANLAPYEVPVRIMVVDRLPRNPMLKVATGEIRQLLSAPAGHGGRA